MRKYPLTINERAYKMHKTPAVAPNADYPDNENKLLRLRVKERCRQRYRKGEKKDKIEQQGHTLIWTGSTGVYASAEFASYSAFAMRQYFIGTNSVLRLRHNF